MQSQMLENFKRFQSHFLSYHSLVSEGIWKQITMPLDLGFPLAE